MKKVVCMMMVLCCWASAAFGEEGEGLSLQAREYVELQTKAMSELGIPEAPARQMLTLMLQNRFEKRNMVQAQQVVLTAARAGLPTEPVMSKALEGMAKQIPQPQIIVAMERVENRYAYACQLAKSLVTEKKNVDAASRAVAESLAAGMRPEDIEAVKTQLQTRTQTGARTRNRAEDEALAVQTMLTVRSMARLGTDSPAVADVVSQALRNEYTSREMNQLREQLVSHGGKSPAAIADNHAAAIGKENDDDRGTGSDTGSAGGNGGGGSGNGSSGSGSSSGGSGNGNSGSDSGTGGNAGGGSGSGSGGNSGSGGSGSGSSGGNSGGNSGSGGSGSGSSGGNSGGNSGSGGSGSGSSGGNSGGSSSGGSGNGNGEGGHR